jgi:Cohesin domain
MRNLYIPGWITILVLVLGFRVPLPQVGETLVCTEPVRLEIGADQSATLQIRLLNAKGIYGVDLQATFDPTVVEVVDADSKQAGIQMTPGEFLPPDFVVTNLADNQTGRLRYVATQLNPSPAANGNGIILTVQLRGKASGSSTKLSFTSVVIADRHGVKQPVRTQAAELVIVAAGAAQPAAAETPDLKAATPSLTEASPTRTRSKMVTAANPEDFLPAQAESNSVASERVLTTISVGGFAGSSVLAGACVWLLIANRRKEKGANPIARKKPSARPPQKWGRRSRHP